MSRERPILFSAAMVRAILAGAKDVTRRPVKTPSWAVPETIERFDVDMDGASMERRSTGQYEPLVCPLGEPGDRIYVREAFADYEVDDVQGTRIFYRADYLDGECQVRPGVRLKWTPSIHMPREVSRIVRDVVSVRIERLRDIDEADALREGFTASEGLTARGAFMKAWNDLYGSRDENQLVWRAEFSRTESRDGR